MSELLTFILDHNEFRKARLPSLYSDFTSLRISNPDGYTANVAAWRNALSSATLHGLSSTHDILSLKVGVDFVRELSTKEWGLPSALPTVVQEGVTNKDFIPLRQFLEQKESVYYKRWIDPWAVLRLVGLSGGGNLGRAEIATEKLVVVKNVEEVAKAVVSNMSKRLRGVDKVFTMEHFKLELPDLLKGLKTKVELTSSDLDVLVRYLTRDAHEADSNKTTLKFKSPDSPLESITPEDISIANLKYMVTTLTSQMDALTLKSNTYAAKAKTAIVAKNRQLALSALRSQKITEKAIERISQSLGQMEGVLLSIEQASDNATIVKTLEQSSQVLQKLNADVGGIDKVEEVVDKLQEQMDETSLINDAISAPGASMVVEDDVEAEFEAMAKEEMERVRKLADTERFERERVEREKARADEVEADKLGDMLGSMSLKADQGEVKERQKEEMMPASVSDKREKEIPKDNEPETIPAV